MAAWVLHGGGCRHSELIPSERMDECMHACGCTKCWVVGAPHSPGVRLVVCGSALVPTGSNTQKPTRLRRAAAAFRGHKGHAGRHGGASGQVGAVLLLSLIIM